MSSGQTKAKDALCIKHDLVTGTTASANLTITGINTGDTLLYVESRILTTVSAGVSKILDRTSTTSITAANTIVSTSNTSSAGEITHQGKVYVEWLDNDA